MKKYFHENEMIFASFEEEVEDACDGLIYVSETDAPLTMFKSSGPAELSAPSVAAIAGLETAPVEEVSFDEWFARLTEERDWWGEREKKIAKRFAELRKLLEENLRDSLVFRFGRIRIDIFVVGRDPAGHIAGVRTRAVET